MADNGLLCWAAGSFAVGGVFYYFYDKHSRLVDALQVCGKITF